MKRSHRQSQHDLIDHVLAQKTTQSIETTNYLVARVAKLLCARPFLVDESDDAVTRLARTLNSLHKLDGPDICTYHHHIAQIASM